MGLGNGQSGLNFAVTAYHAPVLKGPTFALPLISHVPGGNALYVQEVDHDDRIYDFVPINHSSPTATLDELIPASLGDECVYVVVGPENTVAAGTRDEISGIVAEWSSRVEYTLTKISFLEFSKEFREADRLSADLYRQRVRTMGKEFGTAWFIEAILYRRLSRIFPHDTGADGAVNDSRRHLSINIWSDWPRINVSLPSEFYRSLSNDVSPSREEDVRRIQELAISALGLEINFGDQSELRPPPSKLSEAEIINRVAIADARYIMSLKRQEERIAQTLATICARPPIVWPLLSHIRPRATLEQRIYPEIQGLASYVSDSEAAWNTRIEKLVHRLHTAAYPMRKGEMLFEIAHRVRNAGVERAVRNILNRSRSSDVARYRTAILAILGE